MKNSFTDDIMNTDKGDSRHWFIDHIWNANRDKIKKRRDNCFINFQHYNRAFSLIECVHAGHIGVAKQWNDFPLGNKVYFYAGKYILLFWLLHHGRHENTL